MTVTLFTECLTNRQKWNFQFWEYKVTQKNSIHIEINDFWIFFYTGCPTNTQKWNEKKNPNSKSNIQGVPNAQVLPNIIELVNLIVPVAVVRHVIIQDNTDFIISSFEHTRWHKNIQTSSEPTICKYSYIPGVLQIRLMLFNVKLVWKIIFLKFIKYQNFRCLKKIQNHLAYSNIQRISQI